MSLRSFIFIPALALVPFLLHWSCGNNSSNPSAPVTVYVYYTATPSFTFTPCYIASQTPCSPTFTSTNTYTSTPTNSFTPTNTPTFTRTFTSTFTPTSTFTDTFTLTPCNYPGNTCTNTFTPVYTDTPTPSPTWTLTFTKTFTSTWTNTVGSATATFTWTMTPTPFHPWFDTPITIGGNPSGVAIKPDGSKAYVTLSNPAGLVVPISLPGFATASPISVGPYPGIISVTSDNALAVAANGPGTLGNNNTYSLINATNDSFVGLIAGECISNTNYGIATIPGQHVALAGDLSPTYCTYDIFNYINLDTKIVTTYIGGVSMTNSTNTGGFGMAISPDGSTAISTNETGNYMGAIGVPGGSVTSLQMNQYTYSAAIFPNNTEMLVAANNGLLRLSVGGGSVTVISTGWNSYVQSVAITPDSKWAVFCTSSSVEVEDLTANAPLTTFTSASRISENVAITPDGKVALMTQSNGVVQVLHIEP